LDLKAAIRRLDGMRRLPMILVVIGLAAVACSAPADSSGEPIVVTGRDAGFVLALQLGSNVVDAGDPIEVAAQFTWEGAAPKGSVWSSGGGPVVFAIEHLDGDLDIAGAMTADCVQHDYARLVPAAIPFQKSGGFSDDDANAKFFKDYFADPVLRLPAGRWRVSATASGFLQPCEFNAPSIEITVAQDLLVR
jgi:hypothetical protein